MTEISFTFVLTYRMQLFPVIFFLFFLIPVVSGQNIPGREQAKAEQILREKGETYLIIPRQKDRVLKDLSHYLSIDHLAKDSVIINVNTIEFAFFLKKNIPYRVYIYPRPKETHLPKSLYRLAQWNCYPTYEQYDSVMKVFASQYPEICRLDTLGYSVQGRLLLAVKISDNVENHEAESGFMYSSTMHGDETGGYVLMLHLIDYLLSHYQTDDQVTALVDSLEIWINPLANPDGTYHGGNNTVYQATRRNAENIDLNRNFPDPADGPHPDYNDYAPETSAMMHFFQTHNIIMSANFHAGDEVVNYPWDTWQKRHPDDAWFQFISHEYADTVHLYDTTYMSEFDHGITNGYDWYPINGGRQDYVTYFRHGRETTIELDNTKITPENVLDSLWRYNFHSLLNYMEESFYGIAGFVRDSLTEKAIEANIEIPDHDADSSCIRSDLLTGYYHRLIIGGTYDLSISAPGYKTKVIPQVTVTNHQLTWLNVNLLSDSSGSGRTVSDHPEIFPNPLRSGTPLNILLPVADIYTIILTDPAGRRIILSDHVTLKKGKYTFTLPRNLTGICFITLRGTKTGKVTKKLIILP